MKDMSGRELYRVKGYRNEIHSQICEVLCLLKLRLMLPWFRKCEICHERIGRTKWSRIWGSLKSGWMIPNPRWKWVHWKCFHELNDIPME